MITPVDDSLTIFHHFLLSCFSQATYKKVPEIQLYLLVFGLSPSWTDQKPSGGNTAMTVHTADKWLKGKMALPQMIK